MQLYIHSSSIDQIFKDNRNNRTMKYQCDFTCRNKISCVIITFSKNVFLLLIFHCHGFKFQNYFEKTLLSFSSTVYYV